MRKCVRLMMFVAMVFAFSTVFARNADCADMDEALGEAYENLDYSGYSILFEIARAA